MIRRGSRKHNLDKGKSRPVCDRPAPESGALYTKGVAWAQRVHMKQIQFSALLCSSWQGRKILLARSRHITPFSTHETLKQECPGHKKRSSKLRSWSSVNTTGQKRITTEPEKKPTSSSTTVYSSSTFALGMMSKPSPRPAERPVSLSEKLSPSSEIFTVSFK